MVRRLSGYHDLSPLAQGGAALGPSPAGGVTPIDPTTLGVQLEAYYKNNTGLFQDSAGSTPASSDGDPVGRWADQSGNGRHWGQTTSADRPVLKLAIKNGKNVVRFADSTDHLDPLSAYTVNQPLYVFWASTCATGLAKRLWSNNNLGPALLSNSGTWNVNAGTASVNFAGLGQSGWAVQAFRLDGAGSQARRNLVTVDAPSNPGTNGLSAGLQYDISGAQANLHDLAECFLVSGALTENQILGLLQWLNDLVAAY